jgi:hypothetical protein
MTAITTVRTVALSQEIRGELQKQSKGNCEFSAQNIFYIPAGHKRAKLREGIDLSWYKPSFAGT